MKKYSIGFMLFVLTGCATLFSGTSDDITFTSKPSGATVLVDKKRIGATPLTASIDRELHDSLITFALDGCEPNDMRLQRAFNRASIFNITIWPGWAIDAVTGAINKSVYPEYHANLKCQADHSANAIDPKKTGTGTLPDGH